jgi:8-oxo-dGTP pyrophosphatase MutT (NUDIX family)
MTHPFDDTTRRNIAGRCAAFARVQAEEAGPDLKRAAVAIALTGADHADETALLLTRRASGLRSHRAQWALPGGRCDPGETQAQAALRELHEELGVELRQSDVLGLLDDYPTRSGYLITPVVVWAGAERTITANPAEVASVHPVPLGMIERTDAFDFISIRESTRRVIRFHWEDRVIHAPTAAMIYQFREVLGGRDTRVADLEQPVFAWK